jgi:hypothetical protein
VAKDIRPGYSEEAIMDLAIQALLDECSRQSESCLYTSTALFEWLKSLRLWRKILITTPIILSAIAASAIAKHYEWVAGSAALLAGVFPAVLRALELDKDLAVITRHANQYKILQDRFRQLWRVSALGDAEGFKREFRVSMKTMDDLRLASPAVPERFFAKAQQKIDKGHYDFAADATQPEPTLPV